MTTAENPKAFAILKPESVRWSATEPADPNTWKVVRVTRTTDKSVFVPHWNPRPGRMDQRKDSHLVAAFAPSEEVASDVLDMAKAGWARSSEALALALADHTVMEARHRTEREASHAAIAVAKEKAIAGAREELAAALKRRGLSPAVGEG